MNANGRPYDITLRKVGDKHGFGYYEEHRAEVEARCALWNSYTKETCPHKDILKGVECGLCGNKYEVVPYER